MGRQDLRPPEGARAGGRAEPISRATAARCSTTDGCFDTGDVATIDRYGYMQITDRAKDVIKSGGEWISSIDLENLAVGHPEGGGGRGDRRRASEMGRAAAAGHRAQEGRDAPARTTSSASCRARSPNGGCRTTWCSSTKSRTPRPARSRRSTLREQLQGLRAAERAGGGVKSAATALSPSSHKLYCHIIHVGCAARPSVSQRRLGGHLS